MSTMDTALNAAFVATRSLLEVRADDTADQSFFEKNKTMIIAAGAMIPIQLIGGFFYMKRRKAKKIAAAALEERVARLEMGMGVVSEDGYPKP